MEDKDKIIINTNDLQKADFSKLSEDKIEEPIQAIVFNTVTTNESIQPPVQTEVHKTDFQTTPINSENNKEFNTLEFLFKSKAKSRKKKIKKVAIAVLICIVLFVGLFSYAFNTVLLNTPIPEEDIVSHLESYNYHLEYYVDMNEIMEYNMELYQMGIIGLYYFEDRFSINNLTIWYFETQDQAYNAWYDYDVSEDPEIESSEADNYGAVYKSNVLYIGTLSALKLIEPTKKEALEILQKEFAEQS